MTEMFKIMTKKSAVDPNIWFEKASRDGVMTIQAPDPLNVKIPAAILDLRKNFFSVRVCDKWNSLPSEIKNSENVKIFKTSYRRHMSTCPPHIPLMNLLDRWELPHKIQDSFLAVNAKPIRSTTVCYQRIFCQKFFLLIGHWFPLAGRFRTNVQILRRLYWYRGVTVLLPGWVIRKYWNFPPQGIFLYILLMEPLKA